MSAQPSTVWCARSARSTDWTDGGPIIEREKIGVDPDDDYDQWDAILKHSARADGVQLSFGRGPTPLIAAMRAFVASKLGEEVELP